MFSSRLSYYLLSIESHLNGVVGLDVRVREADGPAIVGDNVRDGVRSSGMTDDLAELVLSLLSLDLVQDEAALHVVEESEEVAGLLDAHDIIEAHWIVRIAACLVVDLYVACLIPHDHEDLPVIQRVLQTITEDHHQRHTLSQLVRSWSRSGCPHS